MCMNGLEERRLDGQRLNIIDFRKRRHSRRLGNPFVAKQLFAEKPIQCGLNCNLRNKSTLCEIALYALRNGCFYLKLIVEKYFMEVLSMM